MTYNDFIQHIIDTRGQWNIPEGEYYEVHHIIPKCMGGLPKTSPRKKKHDNLIWLTAQEHYEAHRLLFIENPDNVGLAICWRNFHQRKASPNTPEIRFISGEEYALLQKQYHYLQHKRLSGVNSPSYGKKASPETIEKIKKAKKLQDTVSPPHKGISHSAETRLHLSELAKKQFSNPQNREKVSLGLRSYYKNNRPVNCKKVKCVETGLIFNSISEARKWLGKNKAHISECCNSKVKMSGGYHWEYFND